MATVPQTATTGPISVTTDQGTFTTTQSFVVLQPTPVIEGFSPTSGPPGTSVVIKGQNLRYASSVLLNGQPVQFCCPGITDDIAFKVGTNATSGPITVSTAYGSSTSEDSFTVTATLPLTVEAWPLEAEAETQLLLEVNKSLSVTVVRLNGSYIPFVAGPGADLKLIIPSDAQSGTLTIMTSTEQTSSPQPLTVYPRPVINSVVPSFGPAGSTAQLWGANFDQVNAVWVGTVSVPFTRWNGTRLTFWVPSNTAGGVMQVSTRFNVTESSAEFAVTSGSIISTRGTISGKTPTSAPKPVTGATPEQSR